jgi:hypothetical protein
MTERWGRVLGTDLRSLALFRTALGAYLCWDLLVRMQVMSSLYSDDGYLPRDARLALERIPRFLSLHLSSGSALVQLILFLAALYFSLALTVGYRTRFCAIGSWILFVSMHTRNPIVDGLADDVLLGLLFWAMFVPLNARWSLDGALNGDHLRRDNSNASVGVFALLLQVCFVYWFTDTVQSRELFPALGWMSPETLALLKVVGPALVFVPVATGAIRLAVVTTFVALHLTAAIEANAPSPALICALSWSLFLPKTFWDAVARPFGQFSLQHALDRSVEWLRATVKTWPAWFHRRLASKPAAREPGVLQRAIVLSSLALVLAGYASNASASRFRLPRPVAAVAMAAQLGQPWSPPPLPKADGWYVVEGVRENGQRMDLLHGGPIEWAKPSEVGTVFGNFRLQRFMRSLLEPEMAKNRSYFAGSFCQQWNTLVTGPSRLAKVYVNYMQGQPDGTHKKLFLLEYPCPK